MNSYDGILLIDKPAGISSFGVVSKVRGAWRAELRQASESIKKAKVGHTGTLDPFATGLLILVLGSYCKRAAEFSGMDKTYEVTLRLGTTSTTGDPEGELSHISDIKPSLKQLVESLHTFVGQIEQVPPTFSAIKVNGQRAYKLAREGKPVKLEPRSVKIYSIESIAYSYPELSFATRVSSGTYIRSLGEDIGRLLGTGAYTTALRRTSVGGYFVDGALLPENLTPEVVAANIIQMVASNRGIC